MTSSQHLTCAQVQPGSQTLTLDTGASVRYDWLVLCPGSTYADGPIKNFKGSCDDRRAVIDVRFLHDRQVLCSLQLAPVPQCNGACQHIAAWIKPVCSCKALQERTPMPVDAFLTRSVINNRTSTSD